MTSDASSLRRNTSRLTGLLGKFCATHACTSETVSAMRLLAEGAIATTRKAVGPDAHWHARPSVSRWGVQKRRELQWIGQLAREFTDRQNAGPILRREGTARAQSCAPMQRRRHPGAADAAPSELKLPREAGPPLWLAPVVTFPPPQRPTSNRESPDGENRDTPGCPCQKSRSRARLLVPRAVLTDRTRCTIPCNRQRHAGTTR